MQYIIPFMLSCLVSFSLTPLVAKLALRIGMLNHPSGDRWNRRTIPLMGGVAILVGTVVGVLAAETIVNVKLIVILIGGVLIASLGAIDDRFGTRPKLKFLVQILLALCMVPFGITAKIIPYRILSIPLTLFWVVGLINAFNFLDNMDGLSAGIAAIASFGLAGLAFQTNQVPFVIAALALAGGCLGFLRYNFHPAKIFMGDCGSMLIGFLLAVIAVGATSNHASSAFSTLIAPVVILGVPVFDSTLVTVLRLKHRIAPWIGGRDHSSHRLVALGLSERKAVSLLYALGAALALAGLVTTRLGILMTITLTIVLISVAATLAVKLAKVECYRTKRRVHPTDAG